MLCDDDGDDDDDDDDNGDDDDDDQNDYDRWDLVECQLTLGLEEDPNRKSRNRNSPQFCRQLLLLQQRFSHKQQIETQDKDRTKKIRRKVKPKSRWLGLAGGHAGGGGERLIVGDNGPLWWPANQCQIGKHKSRLIQIYKIIWIQKDNGLLIAF